MPGENLTKVEALTRSQHITVKGYTIEIDLRDVATSPTFRTTATVTFLAEAGQSSFIDAIAHTVHRVTLNGTELDPADVFAESRIELPSLKADNTLEVEADFAYTNSGEGLHRFVDPVDNEIYLYTQFEVPDSRRVFPVFEQPDLKATFSFTIHAPAHWEVVSNQPTPTPTPTRVEGGATWSFTPTPRISSYITALIAGPYDVVRDELTSSSGKTIPLGVFSRKSLAQFLDTDYIINITRKGFEYFESRFGVPYPFEKYDQLFVPEFNAGAMENAGAVTFTETYVFRSQVSDAVRERRVVTILHELAHMWFGDLVTMRWWNDLWLNESFAEWASTIATAEATEWTEAWTTFQAMEKSWAYRQDQLPSTHPIVAKIRDIEDVQVNFDGITYAKGGSVLKQLVAWVGEEAFFRGVHNYFVKHQWGNATLADLLTELEDTSGRALRPWSELWLETAGVNTLYPEVSTDSAGVITDFQIRQTAPEDWPTLRPHRLAVGFYNPGEDGVVQRVWRTELDIDGELSPVTDAIGETQPALILINDDDLAYAKIRLDEHIELVLGNIAHETESTTIRTALGQLALVARNYVTPERRSAVLEDVGTRVWDLAKNAAAGSDAQFQLVKAFAALASSREHAEILKSLREGNTALDGLTIDTDLSWELLAGLALCGQASSSEIDTALEADNTSNGQQAAARARSMLPTTDDKKAVFVQLVSSDATPNAIVRSLTLGYDLVNDQSALEPLVDEYFSMLEPMWNSRTYKIAEYLAEGLYPGSLVSEELVTKSKAWLDSHPSIPALRRIVEESVAGVERALRVQALDRAHQNS